jgi:hypothetical protein
MIREMLIDLLELVAVSAPLVLFWLQMGVI